MAAAPPASVEISTVRQPPGPDADLIFVPGGDGPRATALRAAVARSAGVKLPEPLAPGIFWIGPGERRFVVLPPVTAPETYEDELERSLMNETVPGGTIYLTAGALGDFDVPGDREGLMLSEVLSRVFQDKLPHEMRPSAVHVGMLAELPETKETASQTDPEETTKAEPIFTETGNVSGTRPVVRVGTTLPPQGADVVLVSNDPSFTEGTLQLSVMEQLGIKRLPDTPSHASSGFRYFSLDEVEFVQIVSFEPHKPRRQVLEDNLRDYLRLLTSMLPVDQSKVFPKGRIWIPLLGTGDAGYTFLQSAQIIERALRDTLLSPEYDGGITRIHISVPEETPPEVATAIRAMFAAPSEASETAEASETDEDTPVNEMPDKFHSDHALTSPKQDDLGRDAIAEAIALNVRRVWADQKTARRPFAIHLAGRWGSGKSSILTFLRHKLERDTTFTKTTPGTIYKPNPKGWVVVNYNAWQMQEAGPPWWSLLTAVREQGYADMGGKGHWPRLTDWLWRRTRVGWPWLVTLGVIAALIALFAVLGPENVSWTEALREADTPVAFVLAGIAVLAPLGALAKLVQGWSKSATETAEAVRDLQSDPTAVVKARFEKIITTIERPVAVFVDDLDRCEAPFVVELLQSLQTAYAQVPVLYVVASDRNWIVSAYNQVYKDFQPEISKPGAPLGYLFVKKIFQLSVPVPDLAPGDRTRLTEALLQTEADRPAPTETRAARAQNIEAAAAKGDLSEVSRIQRAALSEGQNLAPEVMKAVTEPENQMQLRHQLLQYTHLFDGNPRAIKRLINALTFRQGYILSAAEDIAFDVIARWTILSLTHPYSADLLAETPSRIAEVFAGPPEEGTADFPNREDAAAILDGLGKEDIEKVAAFG